MAPSRLHQEFPGGGLPDGLRCGKRYSKSIRIISNLSLKICYTFLIVYLNTVWVLPTNLIPPDQVDTLQPSTIPQRIYGSKLVIGRQCRKPQLKHANID